MRLDFEQGKAERPFCERHLELRVWFLQSYVLHLDQPVADLVHHFDQAVLVGLLKLIRKIRGGRRRIGVGARPFSCWIGRIRASRTQWCRMHADGAKILDHLFPRSRNR